MCAPKIKQQPTPATPNTLLAPIPIADDIKQPTDDLTITQASRGASALSRGRGSLGGTSNRAGLGI